MKVKEIEPLVDRCEYSAHYGKPFGVRIHFSNGTRRQYTDMGRALCEVLSPKQRKYVHDIFKQAYAD